LKYKIIPSFYSCIRHYYRLVIFKELMLKY
jgi:hypothetical protein